MTAVVIVLVATNLLTLTALVLTRRRPDARGLPAGRGRRYISIEILNPIELAGSRNRVFGIAGSFLPELTRRIVYDQTAKILRRQLVEHDVVADVSVHVVQAPRATDDAEPTPTTDPAQPVLESFESSAEFLEEAEYLDKVDKVDIVDIVVERPQPPAQ